MNIFKQPKATIYRENVLIGDFPVRNLRYKDGKLFVIAVIKDNDFNNPLTFIEENGKLVGYLGTDSRYTAILSNQEESKDRYKELYTKVSDRYGKLLGDLAELVDRNLDKDHYVDMYDVNKDQATDDANSDIHL